MGIEPSCLLGEICLLRSTDCIACTVRLHNFCSCGCLTSRSQVTIYTFSLQYYKSILMQFNQEWIRSRDHQFKIDQFLKMNKEFRKLELNHMLVSIASHGGTIALTSDKKQILALRADDPTLENVCIFSNDGDIIQKIKIQNSFREIIVSFQYLQDQSLLVLFERGDYWVVDPWKGIVNKFSLKSKLRQGQQIIQGKVFQNGFAFLTTQWRFLFVRNCLDGICLEFKQYAFTKIPNHWIVIPPKQIVSEKVEILIAHPSAGIIQIVENESVKLYYNKKPESANEVNLPILKCIRYISILSTNGRLIAFFCAEPIYKEIPVNKQKDKKQKTANIEERIPEAWLYRIIILSNDFQGSYAKVIELKKIEDRSLDEFKRPRNIVWCEDKALVLQFYNNQLFLVFLDNGEMERIEKERNRGDEFTFLKQEIDGVRLQSRQRNKILRKIPQPYINIFQPGSNKAGALLFAAYMAFQQKQPLEDDELKSNKGSIATGVLDCIESSKFQEKVEVSIQLMKAAAYGKSFLQPNQINNNIIQEVCKYLRILNQLKTINLAKRMITYTQFESLTEQNLLKILLRYHLHYLAFEIYRYLKKSERYRIQLSIHWACCKVESNQNEDVICSDIRAKLHNEKGISFTEIAYKAISVKKNQLALKLLQYEPSIAKKVPLLLWMGISSDDGILTYKYFQRALQQAQLSKDPNLFCMVIQKIRMSAKISEIQLFDLFSPSNYARTSMISYYRIFDPPALSRYYDYTKDCVMSGHFAVINAYRTNRYEDHLKFLQIACEFLKQQGKQTNVWKRSCLNNYINLLEMFIKSHPKLVLKVEPPPRPGMKEITNPKIETLNDMLEKFIAKGNNEAVDDFKSEFKLSDKRVILTRIKILIDQSKWQELENFVQKHQKKYKLPAEMIADLLMKKREETWAMRMMGKMNQKQKDQQYALLQRIGRIRQAITLAADRRDVQVLEDIRRTLNDADLIVYLDEKVSSISKK